MLKILNDEGLLDDSVPECMTSNEFGFEIFTS